MPRSKRPSVTKAQLIRDAAKAMGKPVRPRDIIAALKEQGVVVTSPQVSKTLRAAGFRRRRRGKRVAAVTAATSAVHNGLNLDSLLAAKILLLKAGGVKAAEDAIRAINKLT